MKKELKITIQKTNYVIAFPSAGKLIDIETMKVSIAKGAYNGLINASTKSADQALDLIDAICTFMVVIPELRENMVFDNILDIDPIDAQELVVIYKKVYFPWFAGWLEVMKQKEEELNKLYSTEKDE